MCTPHIPDQTEGELTSSPGPGGLRVQVEPSWVPAWGRGCLRRALGISGSWGTPWLPPPWATSLELADCLSPLNKTLGNSCSCETSWVGVGGPRWQRHPLAPKNQEQEAQDPSPPWLAQAGGVWALGGGVWV